LVLSIPGSFSAEYGIIGEGTRVSTGVNELKISNSPDRNIANIAGQHIFIAFSASACFVSELLIIPACHHSAPVDWQKTDCAWNPE
jgi:hypothetical protein